MANTVLEDREGKGSSSVASESASHIILNLTILTLVNIHFVFTLSLREAVKNVLADFVR